MANLDELLKKASKKSAISVKVSNRDFGLKKTMQSMNLESEKIKASSSNSSGLENEQGSSVSKVENVQSSDNLSSISVRDCNEEEQGSSSGILEKSEFKPSVVSAVPDIPLNALEAPPLVDESTLSEGMENVGNRVLNEDAIHLETKWRQTEVKLETIDFDKRDLIVESYSSEVKTNKRQTADKLETISYESTSTHFMPSVSSSDKKWRQTEDILNSIAHSSDHKVETNCRQTKDIAKNKLKTNQRQSGDAAAKLETKKIETRDKVHPKLETQPKTYQRQTRDIPLAEDTFSSLVGLQRLLIIEIYKSCKFSRAQHTDPLSIEYLAEATQSTVSSIKKTVQRLVQKNFIQRLQFKNGRGGWTVYTLSDSVYQALLREESEGKLETKWRQTGDKLGIKVRTEVETNPSREIDRELNNTNLSNTPWDELKTVDLSLLSRFYITESIVGDFQKNNWLVTREQFELHIQRFSALMTNSSHQAQAKLIKNPRAIFCSNIGRIAKTGVDPLDFIKTEDEELFEVLMEQRKLAQKQAESRESENIDFEFGNWVGGLSHESKTQLVPPTGLARVGSVGHDQLLKVYFREMVWPELKKQIAQAGSNR